MWLLRVGLILPHAPVLLPQVRGGSVPDSHLPPDEGGPLCLLLSPHGSETGVYRRVKGDLDDFGLIGVEAERRTDRAFGKQLAAAWRNPLLNQTPDHGVVVPLVQGLPRHLRVVAGAIKEITGPDGGNVEQAIEDGRAFAEAVEEITEGQDIIVAASAHTSAALSPAAPLMERPAGKILEQEVSAALDEDLGRLAKIDPELWSESGSCGAGPLMAFGLLFQGRKARVTFRDAPFGVGYLLAQTG